MNSETFTLIMFTLSITVTLYQNYSWYKTCNKMNETWGIKAKDMNDKWAKHCTEQSMKHYEDMTALILGKGLNKKNEK